MPESDTEPVETTVADGPSQEDTLTDPFPTEPTTEAGGAEPTQAIVEQDPLRSTTTDQPTTELKDPTEDPIPAPVIPAKPVVAAPVATATATAPALPPDIVARLQHYENLEKLQGRQAGELGQLRKFKEQFGDLDPQVARTAIQAQQEAAQKANLQPWNRGHPKRNDFLAAREVKRFIDDAVRDVEPANQKTVREAMEAKLSPERKQMLDAYDVWDRSERDMSPEDRADRDREQTVSIVRQEIQTMLDHQQRERQTKEYLAKNPEVMGKHREIYEQALDENTSRTSLAEKIVSLQAELAAATGKRAEDIRVVETAKAQTAGVQRAAAVGRDSGAPRRRADPVQEVLKRHASATGDDGFDPFDELVKLSAPPDPNE